MSRVFVIAIVVGLIALTSLAQPGGKRGYIAGQFMIEIDGAAPVPVASLAGGNVTADVIVEKGPADNAPRKQLGAVRVEPVMIDVALGEFTDLIRRTCDGSGQPFSGRIIEADASGKSIGEREFMNALVTEIRFPMLDAGSKEPARIAIAFQPEQVRNKSGGGGGKTVGAAAAKQKAALRSNFRLTIPDVDCSGVSKIESITVNQKITSDAAGQARDKQNRPSGLAYGDLVVVVSDAKAQDFRDWHEDFVVKGNNGQDKERTATVELLSADGKQAIMTLEGRGVGIVTVQPPGSEVGADQTRRVQVQMYAEQWRVK